MLSNQHCVFSALCFGVYITDFQRSNSTPKNILTETYQRLQSFLKVPNITLEQVTQKLLFMKIVKSHVAPIQESSQQSSESRYIVFDENPQLLMEKLKILKIQVQFKPSRQNFLMNVPDQNNFSVVN